MLKVLYGYKSSVLLVLAELAFFRRAATVEDVQTISHDCSFRTQQG